MEVELPDGTIVEFPEGTAPETIKSVLAKRFGGSVKPTEEAPQYSANGVPMNAAAKREIQEKAKAGTLAVSPENAANAARFTSLGETRMNQGPVAAFMGNLAPGLTFGFADEIGAGISAMTGGDYEQSLEGLRAIQAGQTEDNPKSAIAGQIAGAVASPVSAAIAPARGATLGVNVARTAASGAAGGAIYGAGTGEGSVANRVGNALRGALGGALIGGAVPVVGKYAREAVEGIANSRAAKAAIAAAPSVDDLRSAASRLYSQADTVTNLPRADFAQQAVGMLDDAARSGMDDMLTPGAARVAGKIDEAAQSADPNIGFRELDILRKQAGVPAGNVSNRTESAIGSKMVEGIDDYIDSVDPALSGALKEARNMWGQLRRSELVDVAIERAKNAASGFENGLRAEFRRIINNPKLARGFNDAEIAAMKQVVQGTATGNLMRQLGRIGLGLSGQSNGLGATIGGIAGTAAAGPIGGAAAVGFGTAMKALAERSTRKAAEGALSMVTARNALAGLPQASMPWVENMLATGGRAALPQGSVPLGSVLVGR